MDLLYRLFYTAFSMAIITGAMIPVVLVIRLMLSKAPKKYSVWLWLLLFLRGICPISMSSPLCFKAFLNRAFHRLLAQIGLDISGGTGIMRS